MAGNFTDIYEELTWEMFKLSGGNPYLIGEIVHTRNELREKTEDAKKEL